MMSEFEDLVLEYEGGFPGSGPNWAAYEKMKARGRYLEEENARLREAARWIPVGERLPELDKYSYRFSLDVVVVTEDKYRLIGYCDIVTGRWKDSDGTYIIVTHWQPLPQPPEVE